MFAVLTCLILLRTDQYSECQITVLNIDDKISINASNFQTISLGWYKTQLCHFDYILFCIPLSWFAKIIKDHESDINNPHDYCLGLNLHNISSQEKHGIKLLDIINFCSSIDKYENLRKSEFDKREEIKKNKRNLYHIKYGWNITPAALEKSKFYPAPKKTFALILDIKNFDKHLLSNKLNPTLSLLHIKEKDLVNNLIKWRSIASKHKYRTYGSTRKDSTSASSTSTNSPSHTISNHNDDILHKLKKFCKQLQFPEKTLNDYNVYYKEILDYETIPQTTWDRLKYFCWSYVLKSFDFVDDNDDHDLHDLSNRSWDLYFNSWHGINDRLQSYLTNTLDRFNMNYNDERDEKMMNKKFMANYLQICNKNYLKNSIIKHQLQSIFLTLPFWLYDHTRTILIYDYRIEYLRLYLNYPSMTKNLNYDFMQQRFHDVDRYLCTHFQETQDMFKKITCCTINDEMQGIFRGELHGIQNVYTSKYFQTLWQFATELIETNHKYAHKDDSLTFVVSHQFIYKKRLNDLLRNKSEFDKQDKDMINQRKQKQKQKRSKENEKEKCNNLNVITPDSDDNWEFEFENYIRLAMYDLNLSVVSLISCCTRKRTPHRRNMAI